MRSVVLGPRTQLFAAARAPIPQGPPAGADKVRLRRGRVHVLIRYGAYYVTRCDSVPGTSNSKLAGEKRNEIHVGDKISLLPLDKRANSRKQNHTDWWCYKIQHVPATARCP